MERPNKEDYDFNDVFEGVRFASNMIKYADYLEAKQLPIHVVSGSFVITESAQEKLDFILGHSTTRDFPKTQPTKEWAGAVLDFLEITKLLK